MKDLLILKSLNSLEEILANEYIDSLSHKIQFRNISPVEYEYDSEEDEDDGQIQVKEDIKLKNQLL